MAAKAKLEGVLTVDNKGFIKGMNDAVSRSKAAGKEIGNAFATIGPALAGAFSIGAVAGFGSSLIDMGSKLQDSSDALNLSVESLQGLQFAFSQSGANAEVFNKGMITLNTSMEEAAAGNEKTLASFEALGITFGELIGKSPEDVIYMIANGFKDADDKGAALAAVMDLLGKSGAKMAAGLKEGEDGIRALSNSINKLTADEVATLDSAGDKMESWFNTVKVGAAKTILNWREMVDAISGAQIRTEGVTRVDEDFEKRRKEIEAHRKGEDNPIPGLNAPMPGSGIMSDDELAKWIKNEQESQAIAEEMRKKQEAAAQAEADSIAKNQADAAAVVRKYQMDQLEGEAKINALKAERLEIEKAIAAANPVEASKLQIDLAKKAVEIAKEVNAQKKDASPESAAAAASVSAVRDMANMKNAHHLIRAGDAARKKQADKLSKAEQAQIETAAATKALAKAWEVAPA